MAGNGIFGSQAECESSNEFFIQYSCNGVLPPPPGFLSPLGNLLSGIRPQGKQSSAKTMSSKAELEQELARIPVARVKKVRSNYLHRQ